MFSGENLEEGDAYFSYNIEWIYTIDMDTMELEIESNIKNRARYNILNDIFYDINDKYIIKNLF